MKRNNKKYKEKKKKEFSKVLIGQESALIWVMTLAFIALAFLCIIKQYFGELPWLAAMIGFPWTAYGVSQGFYYNKAKKENEIKITKAYELELDQILAEQEDTTAEPEPGEG